MRSTLPRGREPADAPENTLVIACGAIARELMAVLDASDFEGVRVRCLPPEWHNTPARIVPGVKALIEREGADYRHIFVAYGDCGTGGALDRLLEPLGIERLPGAHCYEFFAGRELFATLADEEPGTFYLTDYLAHHFERLVMEGMGLRRHPELRDMLFANYRRVVYLAQSDSPGFHRAASEAAAALALPLEVRRTGLEPLFRAIPIRPAHEPSSEAPRWQS